MSQLRAPAARPERREGGRHGRPGNRSLSSGGRPPGKPSAGPPGRPTARAGASSLPDARIRPQLLRTAVLPAVVAALSGAAAVVLVLRSGAAEPTTGVRSALIGMALLALAAIGVAALGAERTARSVLDRCNALRRSNARGQAELHALVGQLRRGERVPPRRTFRIATGGDEFDLLAQDLAQGHEAAFAAVVQASQLSSSVGNEQKVEVFVNLARRLQSLVHREIKLLDELENEVEDPDLLKGLFQVDHLATRIRRHAENLAVLGGAVSRRQWSQPVALTEVLRSAIAEVEHYSRVKLVPPIDGTLRGHAVADVIHLLAELVENATMFSPPHTQVLHARPARHRRSRHRGRGPRASACSRRAGPDQPAARQPGPGQPRRPAAGRADRPFVVSALARQHGIAVQLQTNIYGGIQAVLVLPQRLLGAAGDRGRPQPGAPGAPQQPPAQARRRGSRAGSHGAAGTAGSPAQVQAADAGHGSRTTTEFAQAQPCRRPPHRSPAPASHAPLPVRGRHVDRRTAADARSGVTYVPGPEARRPGTAAGRRPATRPPAADDRSRLRAQPRRRRPPLPRRRGQEHMAPQLQDAPPPRPPRNRRRHDPGLMAAFRRGIASPRPRRTRGPGRGAGSDVAAPPPDPCRSRSDCASGPNCRSRNAKTPPPRSRCTMASDVPTGHVSDLVWLLTGLVERVPDTRSALLLSSDGLRKVRRTGSTTTAPTTWPRSPPGCSRWPAAPGSASGTAATVRQVVAELDPPCSSSPPPAPGPARRARGKGGRCRRCSATRWRSWSRASGRTCHPGPADGRASAACHGAVTWRTRRRALVR